MLGHADLISSSQIEELKDDYPNIRIGQWFLDPLNPRGPDYNRNKDRILDKINSEDATYVTTCPSDIKFLMPFLSISRYLERIADHCTNISEDVEYYISGKITRHHL